MKGMLIKDFQLIFSNKRYFLILLLIMVFISFAGNGENYGFLVTFCGVCFGVMALNTISFDEQDGGLPYIMTLPVTRNMYVAGKYIFAAVMVAIGIILSGVLVMLGRLTTGSGPALRELLIIGAVSFVLFVSFVFILMPIQFRFGSDNGRLMIIIFVATVYAAAFIMDKISESRGLDLETVIEGAISTLSAQPPALIAAEAAAVLLAVTSVSMAFSCAVMRRKQM